MVAPDSSPADNTATVGCPVILLPEDQVFTCTFCWHISKAQPHVVGRAVRLACEPCYNALLNLSICWVCGEVVVRGDDCVSLGWCFWHKSCYGCLICGNRQVVRGLTVKEVFAAEDDVEDVEKGSGIKAVRGRAVEIDEIPLCAHCYVEIGAEGRDSRRVVNGALQRMDARDGGLSRARYDRICPIPLDSTIYVSVRDPTAPAFKPSPTKPIPTWMVATEDANDYEREVEPTPGEHLRDPSRAETSLQRRLSSYTPSSDRTAKPQTPTPEPVQALTAQNKMLHPTILTPATLEPTPISPVSIPKIFQYSRAGFIDHESLKRPSSRLDRIREESSHIASQTPSPGPYMTPPEWPMFLYGDRQPVPQVESHHTVSQEPRPQDMSDQTSILSSASSRLSYLISPLQTPIQRLRGLSISSEPALPQHPRLSRKSTMLRAKISARHSPQGHTQLPMSSEFLERYGLVKGRETPKPSALLKKTPPSSRRQSREPDPITARLTRNSRSGPTTGLVDETTVVTETDRSYMPRQFSFDRETGSISLHDGLDEREQEGRGRSLQDELRRFLGGS